MEVTPLDLSFFSLSMEMMNKWRSPLQKACKSPEKGSCCPRQCSVWCTGGELHWPHSFVRDVLGKISSWYPQRHVFTQGPHWTRAGRAKGQDLTGINTGRSYRILMAQASLICFQCVGFLSWLLLTRSSLFLWSHVAGDLCRPCEPCNWWERQNCFPGIRWFPNFSFAFCIPCSFCYSFMKK